MIEGLYKEDKLSGCICTYTDGLGVYILEKIINLYNYNFKLYILTLKGGIIGYSSIYDPIMISKLDKIDEFKYDVTPDVVESSFLIALRDEVKRKNNLNIILNKEEYTMTKHDEIYFDGSLLLDRFGKAIHIGDILFYNEGSGFAKGAYLVEYRNGEIFANAMVYNYADEWREMIVDDLCKLKQSRHTDAQNMFTLDHFAIIGNVDETPYYMTLEYISENYEP